MMQLGKGGNVPVNQPRVRANVAFGTGAADVSAYLLDASGKVRGDEGMVFYNQPDSADGSVKLSGSMFDFDLSKVDAVIERIAICAVPEAGPVSGLGIISIRFGDAFAFSQDAVGMTETAIIVGELYRRAGVWKFRAVAQGFNGGLAPLSRHFGIDVAEVGASSVSATAPPAPVATPVHVAPASTVNLKKVVLQKAGKVELRKGGGAIRARLNWQGRGGGEGDLDLYCFYVLKDGTCGKVYWKDLGRADGAPWITLSGDSVRAGEEEAVLHRPDQLRFALFAAYSAVSNGAGSFQSYRPVMTLTNQEGSEVTIPLLNPNSSSYWVAISHVVVTETITIEHVETYGRSGIRALIAAERAPRLHADGTWDVSKGEIEFKRN